MTCRDCHVTLTAAELEHGTDGPRQNGYGHLGLCCDCFDLSCGMPLDLLNKERAARDLRPLRAEVPR